MGGYGKSGSSVIAKQAAAREEARFVPTVHPSPESLRIRKRLEPHLAVWLRHYFPDVFFWKHGPVQLSGIARLEQCVNEGGCFCVVWPRGDGKSVVGKGAAIYAALTGRRRFLVCIGATNDLALDYMEFIQKNLADNELLMADYPECMTFFKVLGWKAIKARNQLTRDIKGKLVSTGIRWRPRMATFPTILDPAGQPYPFAGAIIETRGITATVKGISRATSEGKVIRPDFVLADDLQDPETAASDVLCEKMERTVIGDILPLAGPQTQIACYMPATIMRKGDVSSRFVDRVRHPEFQGELHPMVVSWPKAQDTLWKEYADMRINADSQREGKIMAHKHYLKNRKAMDEGAETSWPARIRKGESSAIETAENLRIELKDQFWAECQGDPIEEGAGDIPPITPKIICSRVADRDVFVIPDWVGTVIFSTDLNPSYAFTSAIVGFGKDQTAAVIWYGLFAKPPLPISNEVTPAVRKQKVYEALIIHGRELASFRCRNDGWYIDASGEYFDPVNRFCAASLQLCGIQATPATGSAGKRYRPVGKNVYGQPRENCHKRSDFFDGRRRIWLNWHADYWRDVSQRAWLGSIGSPGSLSLFKGHHSEFANQCSAEKLIKKGEGLSGKTEWIWQTSAKHDYGDAMAQAFAGAAWSGVGTSGQSFAPMRRRDVRRVRHITV